MKLVINRRVWLRGEGSENSRLLREEDGKRCCVGIYLSALGVPDEMLKNATTAVWVVRRRLLPPAADWLEQPDLDIVYSTSEDARRLYATNDDMRESEEFREEIVAAIFRRHGVEVEYVDGNEDQDHVQP